MGEVLTHMVIGPLLLLLALIFKRYPAKKINSLYGYRTKQSMKSQEAWEYSNHLFNNLFIIIAVLLVLAQLLFSFLFAHLESVIYTVLLLMAGTAFIFFYVERQLRDRFGEEKDNQE